MGGCGKADDLEASAAAVVNPWLAAGSESFRELAGVGVTFKLVWALCQRLSRAKKLSAEKNRSY